jgi:hypothetical protein
MTSQPDKLFRDKLENFQRPAPAGAWDKIEHNLSRPDKKIIWMRIAAGIVLITAAAIVLWPAEEDKQRIAVKQDETPALRKEVEDNKSMSNEKKEEIAKPYVAKTEQRDVKQQKPLLTPASEKNVVKQDQIIVPVPEQKELVAEVSIPEEKETASTTLVYTTAEVNAKFLKKKLPPQATPQAEDASHIQKLIGLAYAAKNSETGLGDLRQKKNDILALNFGKKKGEN